MSIKLYHGVNMIDAHDGTGVVKGSEFLCRLGIQDKTSGRVRTKDFTFGIVTTDEAAPVADIQEAAYIFAGRVAKLSFGVIMALYEKLGKYRNDEAPGEIWTSKKQYGVLIQSNDPKSENPASSEPRPYRQMSTSVLVPYLRDDVSQQDMVATLKQTITVNTNQFNLGTMRFHDEDKDSFMAAETPYNAGVSVKFYNRAPNFELINTDAVEGGTDNEVSGAPSSIVPGDDD